jgi:hypothetical protein
MQKDPTPAVGRRPYLVASVAMGVPVIALLAVPLYSRTEPVFLTLPMFYWWTFLWIIGISVGTLVAHRVIEASKTAEVRLEVGSR